MEPLPSLQSSFETRLAKSNAIYPIDQLSCRTYTVPAGLKNFQVSDLFGVSFLPKACYIGITTQEEAAGSFSTSPYTFAPHNLKQIAIFAQNDRIPSLDFQLDYEAKPPEFLRAYSALVVPNDELLEDRSVGISREQFGSNFAIYAFSMKRNLGDGTFYDPPWVTPARYVIV